MYSSSETQSTTPLSHRRRMIRLLSVGIIAFALYGVFLASRSSIAAQSSATAVKDVVALNQMPSQSITQANVIALAAGGGGDTIDILPSDFPGYTCALTGNGRVKCWGGMTLRSTPTDVIGLTEGVTAIKAGYAHACSIVSGGVKCWGDNVVGQVGDGALDYRDVPVQVVGLNRSVTSLVAGPWHSCAVLNGTVRCWGWNGSGQLGDGTYINRSTPVLVNGLTSGVLALAAGRQSTCALTAAGGVQCWGDNGLGQLGDGTRISRLTPASVTGLSSGVVAIGAGQFHTCALTNTGVIKCWGDNNLLPAEVNGLAQGVTAIAVGSFYNCALTVMGGVKCWGDNYYGQLGDGTTIHRDLPVDVVGLTDGVTSIAAGAYHTCAATNAGVKCWGNNTWGQLGQPPLHPNLTPGPEYLTPVDVPWVAGQQTATIPSGGGILTSTVDNTTYLFAENTFSDTATVTHTIPFLESLPTSGERFNIGHAFEATAALSGTDQPLAPSQPFTITVHYSTTERRAAIESTLALYRWEGDHWLKEPSSVVDPISRTVTATPDRFGLWAVLGDTYRVQLPVIAQSYQPSESTPLTFHPGNDTQPALSPDGQTMIFLSDRAGQTDIFSASITGSPATNLTHTPLAQEDTPVYSPDGSQIAFASNRSGDWDIYLMDADGANVQRTIGYTGTDELHPAFTPDGSALLFSSNVISGNWDIYSATLDIEAAVWMRLTTDPALDRFPSISADGTTIAFRSERDGNSEIYVMDANGSQQRRVMADPAFDGYPSITPDGSGLVFSSRRSGKPQVYSMNLGGAGLITWTTRANWEADHPRPSSDGRRLVYAARSVTGTFDIFTSPFATPFYKAAERGALNMSGKCDWEAGTLAYGLAQAWRASGDDHYLLWLQNWINACIPVKTTIDHVNDGLLGYAALVAYETQGRPEQLAFAQKVANYLVYTATRTADGTLTHVDDTVWDDTLLGTVPFMVEMSKVSGNTTYLEEAITQTIKHAQHLQDPLSGLYRHAWDESLNAYWPVYWARGNSWMLLADVELLASMPITHPQRAAIVNLLQKQAAGLKPLQAADGRWHTVVNRPDCYLESSGSALIGFGLRRAVQAGLLNASEYDQIARLARLGIWRKVLGDGTLSEVSAPTGPMLTEIEYNAVPNNSMQLYGQGALLLLASPLQP